MSSSDATCAQDMLSNCVVQCRQRRIADSSWGTGARSWPETEALRASNCATEAKDADRGIALHFVLLVDVKITMSLMSYFLWVIKIVEAVE